MGKPQVTITLGRSGQKVVKASGRQTDGGFGNATVASRSKRSFAESSERSGDRSFRYEKRMREDMSDRNYGYSSHMVMDEFRIGPKDLRLKLMRKRISRGVEHNRDKHEKMKLHEKVSRTLRALESSGQGLSRNALPSRGTATASQCDSERDYYSSWNSNAVRSRSSDQLVKSSGGFFIDGRPRIELTTRGDSYKTGNVFTRSPLDSSRPKAPMPTTSKRPLNSVGPITTLASASGGISLSPHPGNLPLTVSSFLHSLGLAKYSINFQVEEIDMVALKQMSDTDLKELGIPMGPRKKILLSLQAQPKRATVQAHSNYRL